MALTQLAVAALCLRSARHAAALGSPRRLALAERGRGGVVVVGDAARRAATTTASAPSDLSPMLNRTARDEGMVGVAAFSASSTSVCAAGSAGDLYLAPPPGAEADADAPSPPPVDLWNSPWHGGSLTKSMTSTLAALLVEDDDVALGWGTTLGEAFPEARGTPYEGVTLEGLASHRGGFRRGVIEGPGDLDGVAERSGGGSLVEQRRGVALFGFTTDPAVAPGEGFTYSDLGYTILGSMLETTTGKAWEDMMAKRLFGPLGMDSAYFGCPDTARAPLGHFFQEEAGMLVPMPQGDYCGCVANFTEACYCDIFPAGGPAGNVYMQLGDYIRYYQWHLAGELGKDASGLLSTDGFRRLHSPFGGAIKDKALGFDEYGHGWATRKVADWFGEDDVLWHTGSSQFMWVAEVYVAPSIDRIFFVASNTMFPKTGGAPVKLDVIFSNMISSDDECDGPAVDDLDGGRDPGTHDKCPVETMYGTSGKSEAQKSGVGFLLTLLLALAMPVSVLW